MRIIMLGDIVGIAGVRAVAEQMPDIRRRWKPDIVLANAENAANGSGLTPRLYDSLCEAGVDGITLGDHALRKNQIYKTLESQPNIIRPANLPHRAVGRAVMKIAAPVREGAAAALPPLYVVTLLGRVFLDIPSNDPFATIDAVLASLPQKDPLVLVEIHAEATAEKQAMGWYLDGRVAAVVGTHTHVPTADARILPKGTAYITDLGMSGPHESVLGRQIERVLQYMTTAMPAPFDVADGDPRVCGVCIDLDAGTRRATAIERIELQAG